MLFVGIGMSAKIIHKNEFRISNYMTIERQKSETKELFSVNASKKQMLLILVI